MTFCGNCGTQNDSGSFCFHCGTALEASASPPHPASPASRPADGPDPTLQFPSVPPPAPATPPPAYTPKPPPGQAPPPGYGPPPAYAPQHGYGAPQPARSTVNPFLGWPVADYVRDGGALFCLFACLGMTWDGSGDNGGEKWWVVISVLLAVASLAAPYLARARVVPGWSPLHWRLVKLALTVPFLASVLAALVNELVNAGDDFEGGIGVAVAMGLAGAALAAQPRDADDPMHGEDRIWNLAAVVAAVAAVAVGLLMFVGSIIESDDIFDEFLAFLAVAVGTVGLLLAMAGWPAVGLLRGDAGSRRVFSVVAFTVLGTALFALADDGTALFFWPQVEKWYGAFGYGGTFVLGAAAGLSVASALARRPTGAGDPVEGWMRTASGALLVSAGGSLLVFVALVLGLLNDVDDIEAAPIVVAVLVLVAAGCAGFASTLFRDARRNRLLALGLIGACVLVGLIAMGVANGNDRNWEALYLGASAALPVTGWVVAAWVTLPVLAVYALTVPRPVRSALGPLVPQQAQPQAGYPQPGYPPQPHHQQPPQPGFPPSGGYPPPPPPPA